MALVNKESHSFTCHPHVQWATPAFTSLPLSISTPILIPLRIRWWVPLSGWLTHHDSICPSQYWLQMCAVQLPRLWCPNRQQLHVPRHCCSRFGRRAFSVAGPRAWNLSPDHLHNLSLSSGSLDQCWRLISSQRTGTRSAVEAFCVMHFINRSSSSSSSSLPQDQTVTWFVRELSEVRLPSHPVDII